MFRTEDDEEMWYVYLSLSITTWYLEGYFKYDINWKQI